MKVKQGKRLFHKEKCVVLDVNQETIRRNLFKREKEIPEQEELRLLIREAFNEVRNNPNKYPTKFKVIIPRKRWPKKNINKMEKVARSFDGKIADWVELALALAQKLTNGESWAKVCNDPDTEKWYRLVMWKENCWKQIGGSKKAKDLKPSSFLHSSQYLGDERIKSTVPLIVKYD